MKRKEVTLVLPDRDVEDAKRLLALVTAAGDRRRISDGAHQVDVLRNDLPDEDRREKLALAMFAVREARAELLPGSLSGQPAWDILLALYLADRAGVRHKMGRMIELSRPSMTTGLRRIDLLEAEGLAKREQDKRDGRIVSPLIQRRRDLVNKILSAALAG
jgi:hypothetical protein